MRSSRYLKQIYTNQEYIMKPLFVLLLAWHCWSHAQCPDSNVSAIYLDWADSFSGNNTYVRL